MASVTVRPDDEIYQFDSKWLGPDEYTLPVQARYVAWGTWLACFLLSLLIFIPLGGSGFGGVAGSIVWSIAVSVVASRAVMLVVDHERPMRTLPSVFSAEFHALMSSFRRTEQPILLDPSKFRVRGRPPRNMRVRVKGLRSRPTRPDLSQRMSHET